MAIVTLTKTPFLLQNMNRVVLRPCQKKKYKNKTKNNLTTTANPTMTKLHHSREGTAHVSKTRLPVCRHVSY